jgi:ABC-type uncharacterized transport system involved in gliding motility auxiliary subunit
MTDQATTIKRQWNWRWGLLAMAILLFAAVNILSGVALGTLRADLTEDRLFTLAAGTKNVIKDLSQPIRLRFFFSESLSAERPPLRIYGNRVRELLEQYARRSQGNITLEVIDPEPFSDAEDRAVEAGMLPGPRDAAGRAFYFGLTGTNSIDSRAAIPFFAPEKEDFLEYDLTKLIYSLDNPKKPVLGIVSRLPLEFGPGGMMAAMQGRSQPYTIFRQLREFFDARPINPDNVEIPADVEVLLVVHPFDLTPAAFYAIDQFALRGGRVVAAIDPYSETAEGIPELARNPAGAGAGPDEASAAALKALLAAWGVEMTPGQFVADGDLAQRVQTGKPGPRAVADYLPWLDVRQGYFNRDDVVTSNLTSVNLASAGEIRAMAGATTTFKSLIQSSSNSMMMAVDKLKGDPDPDALLVEFKPDLQVRVLAARLAGPIKSAFPDGPPEPNVPPQAASQGGPAPSPASPSGAAHLNESVGPANIILIADVDWIDDRFWVQTQNVLGQQLLTPFAANGDLALNAVDNLSGSGDLIALRSRGRSARPFLVIESLRRQAEQQFLTQAQALQNRLVETEKRISELQGGGDGGPALLSGEEQAALNSFRDDLVKTRRELRDVQRDLNRDIEAVGTRLKFLNIGLMPLAISVIAVVVVLVRRRRRTRLPASIAAS